MSASRKLAPYLKILVVFGIVALTVNRYAQTGVNADFAINSVMSLQNITLFYWGQNRLANALPLMAGFIRNPAANFYATLYLSSAVHFTLVFLAAHLSVRLVAGRDRDPFADLYVFLLICLAQLIVQRHQEFIFIAGHIEYPLSAALLLLAFLGAISDGLRPLYFWPLMLSCIVIATGVNFSVVLAALALASGHLLVERRFSIRISALLIVSVLATFGWLEISRMVGGATYSRFDIHNIPLAVKRVTVDLLRTFDMWRYLLVLAVMIAATFILSRFAHGRVIPNKTRIVYVSVLLFLFCVFWLVLFAAHDWIRINDYSYRYFTYVIYALFFYIAIAASILVCKAGETLRAGIGGSAAVALTVILWSPFVALHDYRLFREVEAHNPDHYGLYAGNYWQVWPAVLRSMIAGHRSFGLAGRGEGNRAAVQAFVDAQLSENGSATLLCIDESPDYCLKQVSQILDGVTHRDVLQIGTSTHEITLKAETGP